MDSKHLLENNGNENDDDSTTHYHFLSRLPRSHESDDGMLLDDYITNVWRFYGRRPAQMSDHNNSDNGDNGYGQIHRHRPRPAEYE